ncbi:unnamed protein product [Rotaria sordida]|uniref:F-box domain-containing protein n=1 Tax=Rotaria sordida TaxID=392033 RepID=A0A816B8C8_9BILA|nr:unnamed protein product [Rotaria sordida]CAF1608046.1 unnamed protein product [Rotaria sordida]
MNSLTHIEDLSNELFFEIFDYLHALDIFTAFNSLNKRISSILQIIPLRIIISYDHCHRQIDFLSSYLNFHSHQVISIKTYDTIRDYSSIINLLFNRHYFINLQSCIFLSVNPSTKLRNVIIQLKTLNRLISFHIHQPYNKNLHQIYKYNLTRTLLMHNSSFLRSIVLQYPYNYFDISNYSSISSNLISLELLISGSPSIVSVYSILPILRLCHTIRYLTITVEHMHPIGNDHINFSSQTPSINENDLPILPQLTSFNLTILAICDICSISYILRCMPNLIHFHFVLATRSANWPFPHELLDGCVWQQILEYNVPCLSKFEFHMSIMKRYPKLNLDNVVNSFEYFSKKYSNWNMIIDRWILFRRNSGKLN